MKKLGFLILLIGSICSLSTVYGETEALWRFAAGGRILAPPACGNNAVYFVSEDRFIHALDAQGHQRWEYPMEERVSFTLSIGPDQTVYAATEKGTLMSINPAGSLLWSYPMEAEPVSPAAVSFFGTIASATATRVHCLTYKGQLLWTKELDSLLSSELIMSNDGTLYYGTEDNKITAIYAWGKEAWQTEIPSPAIQMAVGQGGTLSILAQNGQLYTLSSSGEDLSTLPIGEETIVSFRIIGESYYLHSDSGKILTLPICSGITNDSVHLANSGNSANVNNSDDTHSKDIDSNNTENTTSLQVLGNLAPAGSFAVDQRNRLYLLNGTDITVEISNGPGWSYAGALPFSGLTLSPDNLLLAGSEDWILYAFEAFPPAEGAWPQRRGDATYAGCQKGSPSFASLDETYQNVNFYIYLNALTESDNLQTREMALSLLEEDIAADNHLVNAPYIRTILQRTATRELNQVSNNSANNPLIRARIYRLIGQTGYMDARNFLIEALYKEPDSYALGEGIEALGLISCDPDGASVDLFYSKLTNSLAMGETNNSLAYSVLNALKRIYRYNGRFNSQSGYSLLFTLNRSSYNQQIRTQARDFIGL